MIYKARGGSTYDGRLRHSGGFSRRKSAKNALLVPSNNIIKNKKPEIVIKYNTIHEGSFSYNDETPYTLYDDGKHKITIHYDPNLSHEAEAKPYGKIYLGKEFFDVMKISEKEAAHILIHELGHVLQAQQSITSTRENIATFEKHPIYRNNWFEGFAESFASYITGLNPTTDELQKKHSEYEKLYPQYYRLGRELKNAKIKIITDN